MRSYHVKTLVMESGERLPVLCCKETGLPLYEPTLYSVAQLRSTNKASATIQQALRSIMVLYLVLDRLGIDLAERLNQGRLLDLGEVEELARQSRLPLATIFDEPRPLSFARSSRVEGSRWSRFRHVEEHQVGPQTAAIRLLYVRDYLKWLGTSRLLLLGPRHVLHEGLASTLAAVLAAVEERAPTVRRRGADDERQGLSKANQATLLGAVDAHSAVNPWVNEHVRVRNQLAVQWLYHLGLRRGELLNIRISDINFQTREVVIARRADDPGDPRSQQPNVKTRARLLNLSAELTDLTHDYIRTCRRAVRGARKHDYLFVANGTGRPMTMAALNKAFGVLRRKVTGLPDDLSPHVLRHTWNDNFSELMDSKRVPEEIEKKSRCRLMGWSETSETAATYIRRTVRRKATEASLELQRGVGRGRA